MTATRNQLLLREPALAMLMGALPQGDNFGFGDDYSDEFGDDGYGYGFGLVSSVDPSMNMGLPGYGFGGPNMYGFGAPVPPAVAARQAAMLKRRQAAQLTQQAWNPTSTDARTMLLDPNKHSSVKVERYSFSFSPASNLLLGTASSIPTFTQQPSTSIKGQRVVMNAPIPGFVLISNLQIANVNVLVGGSEDAYTYSAGAMGVMLDLPRLDPQNRATASGAYTGVLPSGYTNGSSFQFIITLQGPATLAGGYGQ